MKPVPYQRIGEPSDIAQAAVWLASDASGYVTGTSLYVDGGMTCFRALRTASEAAGLQGTTPPCTQGDAPHAALAQHVRIGRAAA